MGQTLAEALTAFAGCKSLQALRFRGEKPKSRASSREEPVIARRMGIPTAKVGPRLPQVAGLAPPQSRVLPHTTCAGLTPTQLATAGGNWPPCEGSLPPVEDLTSSKRKTLKHPKKAPNQARSPFWGIPHLEHSQAGIPQREPFGGLTLAPREGSAGSLPRFRNFAASEPAGHQPFTQSWTGKRLWRAALFQPVKSHLVLNPSVVTRAANARSRAMTGKELRLYI